MKTKVQASTAMLEPAKAPAVKIFGVGSAGVAIERVRAARIAERRLRTLVALRERLRGPCRMKRTRGNAAVHGLESVPGDVRRRPDRFVEQLAHLSAPSCAPA